MRIVKAQKDGHYSKVKTLQWLLTHSFYAKALAVKRVTSNKGKNTAGVDPVSYTHLDVYKRQQVDLLDAMDSEQATPSLSQAQRLKKYSQEGHLTLDRCV